MVNASGINQNIGDRVFNYVISKPKKYKQLSNEDIEVDILTTSWHNSPIKGIY